MFYKNCQNSRHLTLVEAEDTEHPLRSDNKKNDVFEFDYSQ